MIRWNALEPETQVSIELQPMDDPEHDPMGRQCGCYWRRWWGSEEGSWISLCHYHEGFEDGVEKARPDLSDIESVIHQHCGSDSSDDAHNDWVSDLANTLLDLVRPSAVS